MKVSRLKRKDTIDRALALARQAPSFPASRMWLDFDEEADVVYLSFQKPQQATDTIAVKEGQVLLHYREKDLVGITVIDATGKWVKPAQPAKAASRNSTNGTARRKR